MNRKPLLFLGIALTQLAVPAWMITGRERILQQGEIYKFRTAPIDPRDPFRGEYVRLDFEAESGSWPVARPDDMQTGEHSAYAILGIDSAGFARINALVDEAPATGAYLEVAYSTWGNESVERVQLPFDRFYLEEGDGAKTEDLLQPQWNDGEMVQPLPAYAKVRVLDGRAVIEDLIVDERSIHEWLADTTLRPSAAALSAAVDTLALMEDSASAPAFPDQQP